VIPAQYVAGGWQGRDVSWIDDVVDELYAAGWTEGQVDERFREHGFEVGLPVLRGQMDANSGLAHGFVADANGDRMRLAESLRGIGLWSLAEEVAHGSGGGPMAGAGRVLSNSMDFSCGSASAVGHLAGIGGSVGGFLGGRGRATLAAQIAQQAMLTFQARCAAEQARAQTVMLQGLSVSTLPDVVAAMTRVIESLGRQQTTAYGVAQAEADWDKAFRDVSGLEDLPPELMVPAIRRHYVDMRTRSADSMAEAARVRAEAVQAMRRNQSAVEAAAVAGQRSQGIRGVIQAGNQVLASAVGQMQQTASFQLAYYEAHSRIQEEERMGAVLARLFHERNIASMVTEGEVLGQVEDAGAPIGLTGPINIRQAPAHAAPQAGMTFGAFE
jgi:conjugal transfer/entry exclusion protein